MQQKGFTFTRLALAAAVGAAFAAPACAQTNVKIEGLVDAFVGSTQNAGDSKSTKVLNSNGMSTSYFGFKGTEDLGGGLKANFALTGFFRPDAGQSGRFNGNETLFSRDANVGISGSFGAVSLGRGLAPNFLPSALFNPFGDSFKFSPLILHMNVGLFNGSGWSNAIAGDTGWSNQIKYTTPSFGGLTANLHYQFGEAADDSGKNNIGANLLYFNGPISLTAFYERVRVNNPLDGASPNVVSSFAGLNASEQKAWMIGGAYDFTAVKVFATYSRGTHDVGFENKTMTLGASVPVGNGKILLAAAETKREGDAFADRKRTTATVGYDYFLSKRTDLYANYMSDKITNLERGNSFGVGVRHRF